MPLIDSSYFIGERDVPNTTYPDVLSMLNNIIAVREQEYLNKALGYELSKLFTAGILVLSPDQRYLDIKNGVEFTGLDGQLIKWKGLINTVKNSAIADYIYFYWLKQNHTQTSGLGEVRPEAENAIRVSPKHKAVAAWNNMADGTLELKEFLQSNYELYPEFQQYAGSRELWYLTSKIHGFF